MQWNAGDLRTTGSKQWETLTQHILNSSDITEEPNYRSPLLPVRLLSSLPARSMMYSLPNRRRHTVPVPGWVTVLQIFINRIL